jgi:hypothetical protein
MPAKSTGSNDPIFNAPTSNYPKSKLSFIFAASISIFMLSKIKAKSC